MKIFYKSLIAFLISTSFIYAQSNNIIHKGNKFYFGNKIIVKYKSESVASLQKTNSQNTTTKGGGLKNRP